MGNTTQHSGIQIVEVRVRNFRSLKQIDVKLDQLTVLIGENNSGKTSFLEAISTAIGSGRRAISSEDVYLASSENKVPKERIVTIDILIKPVDNQGQIIENFPEFWLGLWGTGISQDDQDNDFVGIHTQIKWDTTRGEYVTERKFLTNWQPDPNAWDQSDEKEVVYLKDIEPISLYLMDAKRDIQDEMYNRNSFWNKLVSDPGLTDDKIEILEGKLAELNDNITESSKVFQHIQQSLSELHQTVASDQGSISLTPIARNLRNLSKGIDVNFATKDAQSFPLNRHGMGTRSLAALLTFQAYTTWRQKNAEAGTIHPMLALEEPEAHLHPQAQRSIFKQIEDIPGQRIVSTHSPYIASQANISSFRHFRKNGADTVVTQLESLELEDKRKINQMVMSTRGELLYARAVVLFEGITEEQALPVFAEKYWDISPNALGITFIGVEGFKGYPPFLKLVSSFNIPWYLFSDGEDNTRDKIYKDFKLIGEPENSSRLFLIPDSKNFEAYLVSEEYKDILITMLISLKCQNEHHKQALEKQWNQKSDPLNDIYEEIHQYKTVYAKPLAEAITSIEDEELRFPSLIRKLFEKISDDLGLRKR